MKRFQYEITTHASEEFRQIVYFCSAKGDCSLEEVQGHETDLLTEKLNQRGEEGWELVQISFGKDGIIAFWKRELESADSTIDN